MRIFVIWTFSELNTKILGITSSQEEAEQIRLIRVKERNDFQKGMRAWYEVNPRSFGSEYHQWKKDRELYAKSLHPDARGSMSPPAIKVTEVGFLSVQGEQIVR